MICELCEKEVEGLREIDINIGGTRNKISLKKFVICEIKICFPCFDKIRRVNVGTLLDKKAKKTIINRLKKNFLIIGLEDGN